MSDKQSWSAWLSEQLEACGDSIDADAFDAIVAELNRRPDPAPVGVRAPDGFALVPVEPSEEMIIDGFEAAADCENDQDQDLQGTCRGAALVATATYQAMVKRAPQQNPQPGAVVGDVVPASAMRDLYRAYVNLLETGRDRIKDLGGECDSVEDMERSDPFLIQARRTLTNTDKGVASE